MKTKTFDCIQMKREGAERVRRKLKGLSVEDQLRFWQKETDELLKLQEKAKR